MLCSPGWVKQAEGEGPSTLDHRGTGSRSCVQESCHVPEALRERWGSSLSWPLPSLSLNRQPSQLRSLDTGIYSSLCLNAPLASHNLPPLPHTLPCLSPGDLFKEALGLALHFHVLCCLGFQPYCPGASLHIYSLLVFCLSVCFCLPSSLRLWLIEGHTRPSNLQPHPHSEVPFH